MRGDLQGLPGFMMVYVPGCRFIRLRSYVNIWDGNPDRVVDLGCGTGLSTLVWRNRCLEVIGIEPSDDMLAVAQKKEMNGIAFRKGSSTSTGLPDKSADAVICSSRFTGWNHGRPCLKSTVS